MSAPVARQDLGTEYQQFLEAHPEVRAVDAITVDLCGILRGKRYPIADLPKLYEKGLMLPYTVYLLDVTGANADPLGRGFQDGDPDGICVPIPGTLVEVPWADDARAQVLMTMNDGDGKPSMVDPRNVAAHVVERVHRLGLHPVLAFELEFYLLDASPDAEGRPQPPISPATGKRESGTQVYGITELDGYARFFQEVEYAAGVQRVPASVATSEYAAGQYEINLRHVSDPLAAADHCALLRNIVKRVAQKHGMGATFMAKPFPELTGNGMHVHVSLVDDEGHNVFDDGSELGSETLRRAVAGLMATMPDALAIFSPHVNGFRRFRPNLYVPVTRSWGGNNRSVAFRIPAGAPQDRRIEHRVAAADANPYLVLAAVFAGMHHGIVNRLDPGPPASANACKEMDPTLPMKWSSAIDAMLGSPILREYLSDEYVELYCATKRVEMERFNQFVSAREYAWYL